MQNFLYKINTQKIQEKHDFQYTLIYNCYPRLPLFEKWIWQEVNFCTFLRKFLNNICMFLAFLYQPAVLNKHSIFNYLSLPSFSITLCNRDNNDNIKVKNNEELTTNSRYAMYWFGFQFLRIIFVEQSSIQC